MTELCGDSEDLDSWCCCECNRCNGCPAPPPGEFEGDDD